MGKTARCFSKALVKELPLATSRRMVCRTLAKPGSAAWFSKSPRAFTKESPVLSIMANCRQNRDKCLAFRRTRPWKRDRVSRAVRREVTIRPSWRSWALAAASFSASITPRITLPALFLPL